MAYPVIDLEKCIGCEECVDVCPVEVLAMENNKAKVVQPDDCIECGSCVSVCEQEAITLD